MWRTLIIVAVAGLLLSGTVRADLEIGTYAPDLEAGDWLNTDGQSISLSELRGMVVVLFFWATHHQAGEAAMGGINMIENHPQFGRYAGVFLIGVTESDRKRVEDMVKEKRYFFPIALECRAAREYRITAFPRVVIIGATGRVAYSDSPSSLDQIVQRLQQVFEDTPPFRTHPREARLVHKALDKARAAVRAEDYWAAFGYLRQGYGRALHGDWLKTACIEVGDLIEALGRDQLARANVLVEDGRYKEAAGLLRETAENFKVYRVGRFARDRLRALEEKDPEARRAMQALDRDQEAAALLSEVGQHLWQRSFGEAYDRLEKIAKEFSDTEIAVDAGKIRARMNQNAEIMGHVRDYQARNTCTSLLAQARSFRQTGDHERARQILRRIINEYPDTIYVEMAYKELELIP